MIVLGEAHLRRTLTRYFNYYHKYRTHLSLTKDAPEPRAIQDANLGDVIEISEVGGLHHHYERRVDGRILSALRLPPDHAPAQLHPL
jgi:hypothetical protein